MLAKYTPTYPFLSLEREMNRLFNDAFPLAQNSSAEPTYSPALNLWEDPKNYFVSTELPGMNQNEIEVAMNGSDLVISGERKEEKVESDEKKTWHRRETRYGKFYRMVSLPQDIDASKIGAELKNGVLTVTVPKAERSQPNKITIQSK
jgi:HSP20 family protein